jgi:hypothetical protein
MVLTYLGLPLSDAKLSACVLNTLAVPVERCITGCCVHTLNRDNRLILNTVMLLKPVYAMAAICLPKSPIDRIDKPRRGMFWKRAAKCSKVTAKSPGRPRAG